jgi:glucose-6-phosphate isomerase
MRSTPCSRLSIRVLQSCLWISCVISRAADWRKLNCCHTSGAASALALGRGRKETSAQMAAEGKSPGQIEQLLPHRIMPGNRPSNIILMDDLTPENLGKLLALYEHSVFVESVIWNINAFDQWGVELGKVMAGSIEPALTGSGKPARLGIPGLDGVVAHIRKVLLG